jgi:hypothetical protein
LSLSDDEDETEEEEEDETEEEEADETEEEEEYTGEITEEESEELFLSDDEDETEEEEEEVTKPKGKIDLNANDEDLGFLYESGYEITAITFCDKDENCQSYTPDDSKITFRYKDNPPFMIRTDIKEIYEDASNIKDVIIDYEVPKIGTPVKKSIDNFRVQRRVQLF